MELIAGTSPYVADTDGDGEGDASDYFPTDPLRSEEQGEDSNPNPPQITITFPVSGITPIP